MPTLKENLLLTLSCAVNDGRVTDAEELEFTAYIAALEDDANRYRMFRAVACEPDGEKHERMQAAIDALEPPDTHGVAPSPEMFDAFYDAILLAADGARNVDA